MCAYFVFFRNHFVIPLLPVSQTDKSASTDVLISATATLAASLNRRPHVDRQMSNAVFNVTAAALNATFVDNERSGMLVNWVVSVLGSMAMAETRSVCACACACACVCACACACVSMCLFRVPTVYFTSARLLPNDVGVPSRRVLLACLLSFVYNQAVAVASRGRSLADSEVHAQVDASLHTAGQQLLGLAADEAEGIRADSDDLSLFAVSNTPADLSSREVTWGATLADGYFVVRPFPFAGVRFQAP